MVVTAAACALRLAEPVLTCVFLLLDVHEPGDGMRGVGDGGGPLQQLQVARGPVGEYNRPQIAVEGKLGERLAIDGERRLVLALSHQRVASLL